MKILHIGFHRGCQNDIEYICNKLGHELSFMEFDDGVTKNNAKYNIGHKRANDCWNKYKDYFYTFDAIITSDTCPISRVFLQNNFEKKLIIWVCNRFDYYDAQSLDCDFPDTEYYDLIRDTKNRKNVTIAGYTPFENYYAKHIRNVDFGDLVIKPIGKVSSVYSNITTTKIPNKSQLFAIPQYHNDTIMINLSQKLSSLNIPNYNGRYNGPVDLKEFKGVIHIPYAWSNLALYESIHFGILYFIPSKEFLIELKKDKDFFWSPPYREEVLDISEWYCDENKELFIYFNSWEDLLDKINLSYYKRKLIEFGEKHEEKYLNIWNNLLN